jgi:hypothetical protein
MLPSCVVTDPRTELSSTKGGTKRRPNYSCGR